MVRLPLDLHISITGGIYKLRNASLLSEDFQSQRIEPDQARQCQQGLGTAAGIIIMHQLQQLWHCSPLHEPLHGAYSLVNVQLNAYALQDDKCSPCTFTSNV